MRELVVATRNEKKLRELTRYLRPLGIKVVSLKEIKGAPHINEDGKTFQENAKKKARAISGLTGGLVLADDSGLVVDALGSRPGVRSSRFAGDDATDEENNAKLLKSLKGVPKAKRRARFVCSVAIANRGKVITHIQETCSGRIGFEVRGRYGFGYDPLFVIPKYNKTFGQLGPRVKDRMSHRAKALRKAVKFLRTYLKLGC
jgi:XTP/dITP diphosphohydrolase